MSRHSSNKGAADKLALWPMWALCGVLLLVIIAGITRAILDERPQPSDIAVVELPAASEIRFQSADFPTGELRQFRISGSGVLLTVKRLVDGHVHAAFSSCKACSRQGRRSYARQNQLLCGVCRREHSQRGKQVLPPSRDTDIGGRRKARDCNQGCSEASRSSVNEVTRCAQRRTSDGDLRPCPNTAVPAGVLPGQTVPGRTTDILAC